MIGIFDSGIGGLTIVREILKQLPDYQITYFGDTARTPYGNKSDETIITYAVQDTEFLLAKGAKIIVVACNTASAVAAQTLKEKFPDTPIFEVITPAVKEAVRITKNKRIGVIGTRATIASKIYEQHITNLKDKFSVTSKPCPLFVPLVEENWANQPVTKMIARKYLYSFRHQQIDTLILGCTHYPLLKDVISQKMGKNVSLVDPAEQTARQLKKYIEENPTIKKQLATSNDHQFYFSDIAPHLTELTARWLGTAIKPLLHRIA